MAQLEPLFDRVEGGYLPRGWARGPWHPGQLHGGAVGALFAEVLQDGLDPAFRPARLTVDLVRPVPLDQLEVTVEVVREGRRLHSQRAVLVSGEKPVAVASLLSLRASPLPEHQEERPLTAPDRPSDGVSRWSEAEDAFLGGAMSFRFVAEPGTGEDRAAWVRLHRPVLADRPASPLARAAAASDITSVVTRFEGRRRTGVDFLNADFSLHLHREPEGEWLRVVSLSRWEPNGIGTVTARLTDEVGSVGQVTQALLLTPRSGPAP